MTEEKDEKQIDAITDQKIRLETLSNKDDHKSIDKKIFDRVVIERFDEIKELTNEIDHDDLIYHFKNNTNKNINDFDDGIELFQKIQSGEMNLTMPKNCKVYLNQIWTKYQKEDLNQNSKKVHQEILNCFTNQDQLLLNYSMNIL